MSWDAIKEAKERLRRERGAIQKDWGGRIPIALIYPNSYPLGMSNLGFQTIYRLLNSDDRFVCERAFWESPGAEGSSGEYRVSLESQRPLEDFALLAFSISYELDYFHVVELIKSANVPLLATQRQENHPLIIAGGPCITANPEPLAPFFDAFAIGEGEVILPPMLDSIAQGIQDRRDGLLRSLASLPGIYVPNQNGKGSVARQWARDLNDFATTSTILTPDTELSDMYLMEVSRGCPWGCRFCLAGFLYRPMRLRSLENLVAQAREGLKSTKRLGLLGAAVSDHPQLDELVTQLLRMDAQVSLSSLRINTLSEEVLQTLVESGTRTVTLAPEAGSDRLRRFINKSVYDDDILRAVDKVAQYGLRQLKLYFMVGLPTETEEDVQELVRLVLRCKELIDRRRGGTQITLNLTPFVPKAGTPFQRLPMAPVSTVRNRLSFIERDLQKRGIEVRKESAEWSAVQGVLARGDSRLGAVLAAMEGSSLASWRKALEEQSLDADSYIYREIPTGEDLPWSSLDSGIDPWFLGEDLQKARDGRRTSPCPPKGCHKCGVC